MTIIAKCVASFASEKEAKKTDAPLSARETELIVSHFFPNFEMEKDFLPLGCCGSCRANLSYRF